MQSPERYDVVVIGGAFAGASTALLLRRDAPHLRVLVVEKAEQFDEKVGEATTEMSGMFLTRRLALWQHLEMEHLPKEGLRYWFQNEHVTGHADASESGGFVRSTVPSFQLRRDALDEHILATAVAEGAILQRPARVTGVQLGDFDNELTFEKDGETSTVRCRWIVDASGRACWLGRKLELIDKNEAHPTAAIWCRWKNVKHIDDLAARGPLHFAKRNVSSRRLATNHYTGLGYWVWFIPLGNGETSVGVVFDKRFVKLHESRDRERDFVKFLEAIPSCAELLPGATMRREDLRFYGSLPYVTRQYMGRGWALVGDAAAFIDPYYSPGLDHASFSTDATVEIIRRDTAGENVEAAIVEHNETFLRSYHRFFEAAYLNKYYYMGEHDLLTAAFLLDTAQYYIFVVTPAYRIFGRFVSMPVLGPKPAFITYHLMKLYNRRLGTIALERRRLGIAGRRNNGRRIRAFFDLGFAPWRMGARGLRLWLSAEVALVWAKAMSLVRPKRSNPPAVEPAEAEASKA